MAKTIHAATCRECERPFLVLDARRRFFCNDRERTRHAHRERRRRLATEGEIEPAGEVSHRVIRGKRKP